MAEGIQQRVPANAASVRDLRCAIVDFVQTHCANADEIAGDVALAVTEACANVVRHAYPGRRGDLCMDARMDGDELVVEVADRGVGFVSPSADPGLGLGLRLIEHLADSKVRRGCGTVVEMRFAAAPR
jgi:serine/threonine-protein kinase RsbW